MTGDNVQQLQLHVYIQTPCAPAGRDCTGFAAQRELYTRLQDIKN